MIYKSQEPLRIISDFDEDSYLTVMKVPEKHTKWIKEQFKGWPRLEEPLKPGNTCYLYIQSGFYRIRCNEVNS